MTHGELLARTDSRELSEWIAFYSLEPWGERFDYLGTGIVAATLANLNRKKGAQPYKPEDFMPKFKETRPQTIEEMIQIASLMTAAMGGEDRRKPEES